MICKLNISDFFEALNKVVLLMFCSVIVLNCNTDNNKDHEQITNHKPDRLFYVGTVLSYGNEIADCSDYLKNGNEITKALYQTYKQPITNLLRIKLWGQGSQRDNATPSVQNYKTNLGMSFYNLNIAE